MTLNIPEESPESLQFNSNNHFTNTFETKSGWYVLCEVPLRRAEMCLFRPTSEPTGGMDFSIKDMSLCFNFLEF